jgi:hypothetical protein
MSYTKEEEEREAILDLEDRLMKAIETLRKNVVSKQELIQDLLNIEILAKQTRKEIEDND